MFENRMQSKKQSSKNDQFLLFLEIYKLLPSSRSTQILQKTQIKIVHAIFIEPSFVRKIDRQKKIFKTSLR